MRPELLKALEIEASRGNKFAQARLEPQIKPEVGDYCQSDESGRAEGQLPVALTIQENLRVEPTVKDSLTTQKLTIRQAIHDIFEFKKN